MFKNRSYNIIKSGSLDREALKRIARIPNTAKWIVDLLNIDPTFRHQQLDQLPSKIKYPINIFKVRYPSRFNDKKITASGLLIIPETSISSPLMIYNHGTLLPLQRNAIPSKTIWKKGLVNKHYYLEFIFYALWASQGNVVLAPDYIGFGSSRKIDHPYLLADKECISTGDMLDYCTLWMDSNNIDWKKEMRITGCSEGGLQGLVLHKHLTKKLGKNFTPIKSYLYAGPYSMLHEGPKLFTMKKWTPVQKLFYSWALYSILRNNGEDPNEYFIPRITSLNDLFRYAFTSLQMNPSKFLSEKLFATIGDDLDFFTSPLKLENCFEGQLHLFHGERDELVPHSHTKILHDQLTNMNCEVNVHYIEGAGHVSGIYPYFLKVSQML